MSKAKILLVEDGLVLAANLQDRLEAMGYTVTDIAASGAQAIRSVAHNVPDLILMDIILEGSQDGIETARKIRSQQDIPVVFMTATTDPATFERAREIGPIGYLIKPFEERELEMAITVALNRHSLESKLKKSHQWLGTVLNSIGDAIIATDGEGNVEYLNPVAEALTGWRADDARHRPVSEILQLMSQTTGEPTPSPILEALASGETVHLGRDTELVRRNGTSVAIEDSASPIRNDKGELIGCAMVFRDVTRIREAETVLAKHQRLLEELVVEQTKEITTAHLRIREETSVREVAEAERLKLASIVENSPNIIAICRWPEEFVYLNQSGRLTLNEEEESVRASYPEIMAANDRSMIEAIDTAVKEGRRWRGECIWKVFSGSGTIPVELEVFPLPVSDPEGAPIVALIVHDITNKRHAENQRRRLQEKLDRAERMKSLALLAGGVAHDLNNILGPLVGYPDLLLRKLEEGNPLRTHVERIGKAAQDAANIVQDLLTLARRGRYEMAPLDINRVISDYAESPGFLKLKAENPELTIRMNLSNDLPLLKGSPAQLMKVVMNLVVNAFEAMYDTGSLTIETSHGYRDRLDYGHDRIPAGEYITVSIADTGTGIPPEDVKRIFEPYYSSKKMKGRSGTGLGLAIVYGILKDHQGYYDVASKVGEGTKFILYFPVTTEAATAVTDKTALLPVGHESILVVDDNDDQRELAREMLEPLGYKVSTARNGHEAVRYLRDQSVDLLLLDMIMEEQFDGLDTYREVLRVRPRQKAMIVSGFSETERVRQTLRLGAGTYVKKPFSQRQIAEAVRTVLEPAK